MTLRNRISSLRDWDAGNASPPADRAKHRFLARLARDRGNRVFIESGTYRGDTTWHMLSVCDLLITVELDAALAEQAQRRFHGARAISVVHGDSAEKIPELVRLAPSPPLVWLDGHYSYGDTAHGNVAEPAVEILRALTDVQPQTTIVVDDLRLFGSRDTFPSLSELVVAAGAVSPLLRIGPDSLVILS